MEYIEIKGIKINIKQHGFTEDEILNDFRLRNLIEDIITKVRHEM